VDIKLIQSCFAATKSLLAAVATKDIAALHLANQAIKNISDNLILAEVLHGDIEAVIEALLALSGEAGTAVALATIATKDVAAIYLAIEAIKGNSDNLIALVEGYAEKAKIFRAAQQPSQKSYAGKSSIFRTTIALTEMLQRLANKEARVSSASACHGMTENLHTPRFVEGIVKIFVFAFLIIFIWVRV